MRTCFPRGKKAGAAVGDYVTISPQGQREGTIEAIHERRNLLYRSDEFRTKQFAANVDQLLIVVAVEPVFSEDLLVRALVAGWSAGITPIIILKKIYLADGLPAERARMRRLAALCLPLHAICAR